MFYSQRPKSIPCNKNLKGAPSEFKQEISFSIVYITFHFFGEITKKIIDKYYLFNTHLKNTIRFYLFVAILHQKWSLWRCLRYYCASLFVLYQFSLLLALSRGLMSLSAFNERLKPAWEFKIHLDKTNTLFEVER